MQDTIADIMNTAREFLPQLAAAAAILVGGWIVARILGALTTGALKRTELDNRLAGWIGGERGDVPDLERMIGRGVFYLAMLFVLVGFFQALGLQQITEPLNALLTEISQFAPRLLGAAGLLVVAWVIATALRRVATVALEASDLDGRLGEQTRDDGERVPLSGTLADALYWLVFLLFLPAILSTLAIEGLLAPVQSMTDQLLSFLPNLFAAGMILGIGWLVARLVQRIVTNLLAAAGADAIPARIGMEDIGQGRLSHLVGLVVYVFVLVPVVISSLNALQLEAVTQPASQMLGQMLGAVPGLFAAVLVMVIAFAVGRLVRSLVTGVLSGTGFDGVLVHLGLAGAAKPGGRTLSEIAGSLVLVFIMVFAAVEAADMIGFTAMSEVLSSLIVFAGQVLLGLFVLGMGLWLGDLASGAVRDSAVSQADTLALAARVAIVALAGAMALRQMGVGEQIIELAFGLTLGSVAVAAALAFGLGSREIAGEQVRRWRDGLDN